MIDNKVVLRNWTVQRGAKSKRKSKPSPRHDDDAKVAKKIMAKTESQLFRARMAGIDIQWGRSLDCNPAWEEIPSTGMWEDVFSTNQQKRWIESRRWLTATANAVSVDRCASDSGCELDDGYHSSPKGQSWSQNSNYEQLLDMCTCVGGLACHVYILSSGAGCEKGV